MHVEMNYLRAQTRLHLGIHLVAGLHQLFCQLHMISRKAVMCPQCQSARQETYQMVLKERRKKGLDELFDSSEPEGLVIL